MKSIYFKVYVEDGVVIKRIKHPQVIEDERGRRRRRKRKSMHGKEKISQKEKEKYKKDAYENSTDEEDNESHESSFIESKLTTESDSDGETKEKSSETTSKHRLASKNKELMEEILNESVVANSVLSMKNVQEVEVELHRPFESNEEKHDSTEFKDHEILGADGNLITSTEHLSESTIFVVDEKSESNVSDAVEQVPERRKRSADISNKIFEVNQGTIGEGAVIHEEGTITAGEGSAAVEEAPTIDESIHTEADNDEDQKIKRTTTTEQSNEKKNTEKNLAECTNDSEVINQTISESSTIEHKEPQEKIPDDKIGHIDNTETPAETTEEVHDVTQEDEELYDSLEFKQQELHYEEETMKKDSESSITEKEEESKVKDALQGNIQPEDNSQVLLSTLETNDRDTNNQANLKTNEEGTTENKTELINETKEENTIEVNEEHRISEDLSELKNTTEQYKNEKTQSVLETFENDVSALGTDDKKPSIPQYDVTTTMKQEIEDPEIEGGENKSTKEIGSHIKIPNGLSPCSSIDSEGKSKPKRKEWKRQRSREKWEPKSVSPLDDVTGSGRITPSDPSQVHDSGIEPSPRKERKTSVKGELFQ